MKCFSILKPAYFSMWDTLVFSFDSNVCFPIRQTCFTIFIKQPNDTVSSALQIIFSHVCLHSVGRWFTKCNLFSLGFLPFFVCFVLRMT